jgi:hypothetical protein
VNEHGRGNGYALPNLHGAGNALVFLFTPAGVPEMESECAVKKGGGDVGQKLNYNVGHPRILLEAYPPCSIT